MVKVTEPTTLQAAAVAATTSSEEFSALNPELLRETTPRGYGAYLLKIPPGKKEAFERNILVARAQFPVGSSVYYASRETLGDASAYPATAHQVRRARDSAETAAVVAGGRKTGTTKYQASAAGKPAAKTALREKARKYEDLPKLVERPDRERPREISSNRTASLKGSKEKKEIVVAHNAVRSSKEAARPAAKESARRSEKAAAEPMTAGMLGGLGTSKKAKKDSPPALAKKSEETSKSKKKKKEN